MTCVSTDYYFKLTVVGRLCHVQQTTRLHQRVGSVMDKIEIVLQTFLYIHSFL